MLKLKLQYFGHLNRRADLLEETLILGKIEGYSVKVANFYAFSYELLHVTMQIRLYHHPS